jgi:hypothetical protein
MILDFHGLGPKLRPPGWQAAFQTHLWGEIKRLTTGPGVGVGCIGVDPFFANQQSGVCISTTCKCWDTIPQGLEAVCNSQLPVAKRVAAVRVPALGFEDIVDATLRGIDAGLPSAALGNGGHHFVVVYGYKRNATSPRPRVIAGRRINGVYVRDPDNPARNRLISMTNWKNWFDEVDCGVKDPVAGYTDHQMIVAVVPRSVGVIVMPPTPPSPPPPPPPPPALPPGPPLIGDAAAIKIAIHEAQLLVKEEEPGEGWEISLLDAEARVAHLVERLDRKEFFYVVPFVTKEGRESARMLLDAATGELLEVDGIESASEKRERWVMPAVPPDKEPPRLVWQPCEESQTALLPFYWLPDGTYQRVDGRIFRSLTVERAKGR